MYCFAKICRLCLSHESVLIHCRARDKNNIPNYHKIRVIFPQLINKQFQHFPIWICVKCQEQVNQSYEFKQKCYQTYKLLKKYSMQLYAANKEQSVPDLPKEIFQDVKPIIDNNVISIDDDEHLHPYYNADDITIVKHELLPSNIKTEPEFNNMLQSIIDSNFETIRQIDGENYALNLKREQNTARTNKRVSSDETIMPQEQIVQNLEETCIPSNNRSAPTPDTNTGVPSAHELNENNNNINPLNANFTFDYTNDCFEQFASQVSANVIVTADVETELCVNNQVLSGNGLNTSTRVLRRRKSICYKTLEKSSLNDIYSSSTKVIEEVKKRRVSSAKKQLDKGIALDTNEQEKTKQVTTKPPLTNSSKTNTNTNTTILGESIVSKTKLKAHKKKYGAYFCEKCSKQYVAYPRFRLHVSQCQGVTVPQCNICHKVFASTFNLKRHDKIHVRANARFSCHLCRKHFAQQSNLRQHCRQQHAFDDAADTGKKQYYKNQKVIGEKGFL